MLALKELLTQLRAVFDLVVSLQHKQELIIPQCFAELERRNKFEQKKEKRATAVSRLKEGMLEGAGVKGERKEGTGVEGERKVLG